MLRYLVLIVLLLITATAVAQDMPARVDLPGATWVQIATGGETICGHGAPYSFHYREGPGDDLLIHFQGGGMCWNPLTCNISTTTFDDSVLAGDPSDNPGLYPVGIMDFGNPENPFLNYDMVYVNYCTGDMHTGNATVGHTYEGNYFEVQHKGFVNTSAVLNWVYGNIPAPQSVFISGCSAGAAGAAYWARDIMSHYAGRRAALLSDSGGGWRGGLGGIFASWGTSYNGLSGDALSIEQFFIGTARAFPGNGAAQYNTAYDESQSFFVNIGFGAVGYPEALPQNLRDIANRAGSFRSFTAGGDLHCILPRGQFYSYAANGVRFRDWVADLAAGRGVRTVACTDCAEPEIWGQPAAPKEETAQ